MGKYTYKQITAQAQKIKQNIQQKHKNGTGGQAGYYIAKAILTPGKDIKKITINKAQKQQDSNISRQIPKKDYITLCKNLINFVEKSKDHRLPNYIEYKGLKISPHLLTGFLAMVLSDYVKNGKFPDKANINHKWYIKPVETGNKVYDYFSNKTGTHFKTMDEILGYVQGHFNYQKYFDDYKSNKGVSDSKAGNCVDLLQWFMNMVEPLGYESRCIHVKCRVSGTGHVFGEFKHAKYTGGKWVRRDIASVADGGGIMSVWCGDGFVQGVNPSWFMENLNR